MFILAALVKYEFPLNSLFSGNLLLLRDLSADIPINKGTENDFRSCNIGRYARAWKAFETAFGEAQKIISRKEKDHVFKIHHENPGKFFNSLFL